MSPFSSSGRRFAVVTNIPTPYRLPLFDELARQLGALGDELLVIFAAEGYSRRQWSIDLRECDFRFEVLNNRPWSSNAESALFSYRGLPRVLRRERPAAVLVGGFNLATTRLMLDGPGAPRPYLIWSGAISNPHRPVGRLRRWHRRRLVAASSGFVAYGSRARDYLVQLGARAESVEIAMNTVDVSLFAGATEQQLRGAGTEGCCNLLYVGNLTTGKRLDRLLTVLPKLRSRDREVRLILVGDGAARVTLERQADVLGIADRVRFMGFRQQDEIPGFLAQADLFLFPSQYDVWGLVLVEAMAAGLPALSSPLAGATADLIREGDTGFAVDFSDAESVAGRIDWLLDHPEEAEAIGARARHLVETEVTLEAAAAGFVRAFRRVAGDAE